MGADRWKLVSLWISQTARVTADNALRFFVCFDYASNSAAHKNGAWHLVNIIFALPALVLAPLNGALCNTLPKPVVLRWTAFYGLAVMSVFLPLAGSQELPLESFAWVVCWVFISVGSAVYGPTRYAMLPAAAIDTKWPLTRINAVIEMGTFSAILGGLILIVGSPIGLTLAAIVLVFALNAVAWLTALPVSFPSDLRRAEPAWNAVRDFFTDVARIWRIREARYCLLGLSGKRGLVIGMSGAILAILFKGDNLDLALIAQITGYVMAGVAIGSLLAGVQKHPRRVLALVPLGGLGFTLGMGYAAEAMQPIADGREPQLWFCTLVGVSAGLINVPLAATYQFQVPDDARGNAMAVRNMADYVFVMIAALSLFVLSRYAGFDGSMQLWVVAGVAGLATVAAAWIFRREITEQTLELICVFMYRFRTAGPGLDKFPLKGPVIVICNHSCYLDPMLLGKVVPRSLVAMMTSIFFDHWLLRWMMIYLADAIRVQQSEFRRDVPELKEAVAALDAGKCLVIFPEGRLRRREDQPLKMFGQGVWHILKERPNVPVVVCWIEGGWGSYLSYCNGPPTKNKKFDIAYPIGVVVGEPHVLSAEVLSDHRKTRAYLMEQCAQMRKHLGLEPIALGQVEEEEATEEAS